MPGCAQPCSSGETRHLAWLLATRSGDTREALDHITRALTGVGRRADLLDTRGQVYLALKEPDKALKLLSVP